MTGFEQFQLSTRKETLGKHEQPFLAQKYLDLILSLNHALLKKVFLHKSTRHLPCRLTLQPKFRYRQKPQLFSIY